MKKLLLTLLLTAGCTVVLAGEPQVRDAWVREAPPGASMMAAYLVIENPGDKDLTLVSVDSPDFAHVMMHRSVTVDGVARMQHQHSIAIPAHGSVALEPGGYHLMMPAPEKRLTAGDEVGFVLHFADRTRLPVTAEVRKKP
jgi:copper(I)-binding protein